MENYTHNFIVSDTAEPHRIRTKQILKSHPDIRKLIGKNPLSFFAIVVIVSIQLGLAYWVNFLPWWVGVVIAYIAGAFADHALFVLIHECAHKLVFQNKYANRLAGIFANIPLIAPSSVTFERYHLKHHSFQGVFELDGDLPNEWEAKLINNNTFGKMMWLLFYPLFQVFRLGRLKEIKPFDVWTAFNWGVQITFVVVTLIFWGPKALVYLTLSFFFSVGLHPLGGRWIQEHYLTHGTQETYSYYGLFNKLAFNVGYHNEHHDFPSVPWNKLPQIKSKAPSFYDSLFYHTSWTKLLVNFLFDNNLSLYSRVIRKDRGKVTLSDESKPDMDLTASFTKNGPESKIA